MALADSGFRDTRMVIRTLLFLLFLYLLIRLIRGYFQTRISGGNSQNDRVERNHYTGRMEKDITHRSRIIEENSEKSR